MGSQLITLGALESEYKANRSEFRGKCLDILLPSAVYGTAVACRGEKPFTRPQRWACQAALKVAGWLASTPQVNIALLIAREIGVEDVSEATRLLGAARSALGTNADDAYRLAKQLVRTRVMSDPDERKRSMQEIYGLMDATPESHQRAGNGHSVASNGVTKPNGHAS
jgi:hypothetical protein